MSVLKVFAVRRLVDNEPQEPYLGLYTVGSAGGSISIPSQINRAQLLAHRLIQRGEVRPGDNVCIIGAGFAGVTAAVCLARYRVRVFLVEKAGEPFSLQWRSQRVIHPYEYDWPHPWYDDQAFPPEGPTLFTLTRAAAQEYAETARLQLERLRREVDSHLTVRYGVEAEVEMGDGPHAVTYTPSQPGLPTQFKVVIRTNTMRERIWADKAYKFRSARYWDNDRIVDRVSKLNRSNCMVISGAGDGGLQDFIYYATEGLSPLDIIKRVDGTGTLTKHLTQIARYSLQRDRSYPWRESGDRVMECRISSLYHVRMMAIVRQWAQGDIATRLCDCLAPDRPKIVLLSMCTHFTPAFPLNVFVALALAHAARNEDNPPTLRFGTRLAAVKDCVECEANQHDGCRAAHELVLAEDDEAFCTMAARSRFVARPPQCEALPTRADLVLLRHGIEWDPRPGHYVSTAHPLPLWFE